MLLLPCSVRSVPGSGNFPSIMSHMETLIVVPDGYSLEFSSSSIASGHGPFAGPVWPGPDPPALLAEAEGKPFHPQPVFDCLQAVGAHVLAELEAPGHAAFALGMAVAIVLVAHQPTQ